MTPEKDKQLCEKYPKIFRDRNGDMQKTLMCFGFCHDDGWFDILDSTCDLIQRRCDSVLKREGKDIQVIAIQVKEKFGSLRFYVSGGDDYTNGIIALAESLSSKICENCGNAAELRTSGWWVTQCETCHKKYFENCSDSVTERTKNSEI